MDNVQNKENNKNQMMPPSMTFMSLLILSSVLLGSQLIAGNATAQTPPYTFTAECRESFHQPGQLNVAFTFTSGEREQGGSSIPFYAQNSIDNGYTSIPVRTGQLLFGAIGEPGETYAAKLYADVNDNFQTVGPEENELIETVSVTCPGSPPPSPEPPLTERFADQGRCVAFANHNPESGVTKEACKAAFKAGRI